MIIIKKVLNSSVVLVEKNGNEMIALGKGIGFGKKIGQFIEEDSMDKLFIPFDEQKNQYLFELLQNVSIDYFEVTKKIVTKAEKEIQTKINPTIYVTLTDHIHFAVERSEKNLSIVNRLYWEIKNYYPEEFKVGQYALEIIQQDLLVNLPKEEAANIAFHLINAQTESVDNEAMEYAKMTGGIVNMVRYSMNKEIDTDSIHYVRFITHVKYFVERFYTDKLLSNGDSEMYKQMWLLYPAAMEIAVKVRSYVHNLYDVTLSDEEIVYLGVHVNRLLSY